MNLENRFKYYIGDLYDKNSVTIENKYIDLTKNKLKNPTDKICKTNMHTLNTFGDNYSKKLIRYLKEINKTNNLFLVCLGDVQYIVDEYCIVKNRTNLTGNKSILLKCLNEKRHWSINVKNIDISYHKKKTKVIWRGVSTGNPKNISSRFTLVEKWFNKNPNLNIGFNMIVQNKDNYKKYVKNNLTRKQLLTFKFILSVEGNDKDSGLNWKLNSNSLVLMAKPTKFSWLMEDNLVPNVHYVLLKDDFSDLEEKFKWCKNNPNKCKEIISNANNYMKKFKNKKQEEQLEKRILNAYFKTINFK